MNCYWCSVRVKPTRRQQHGFSLILVLVVLLVLGGLGMAMTRLLSADERSVSLEVLSLRAFYGAESAAQAYAASLFPVAGGSSLSCSASLPSYSFSVAGLVDCQGRIENCQLLEVSPERYLRFEAVGNCGSGQERATRRLRIMVQQL